MNYSVNSTGDRQYTHLPFLDGMRGLAALYVVFHHFLSWRAGSVSPILRSAVDWAAFGHFMVSVFIVLSGFSLMLPVAISRDHRLRGGMPNYFKRRAKRILPPYLSALALSVLVVAAITIHFNPAQISLLAENPELNPGSLLSHLFLVHNLNQEWNFSINMALWSVATEWQIYFLFPFILLPVWRRAGSACLIVGLAIGLLPHFLLPSDVNLDWACPWYTALFAAGMIVASLFSCGRIRTANIPFWITLLVFSVTTYVVLKVFVHGESFAWARDLFAGAVAISLIAWFAAYCAESKHRPFFVRALESPICVTLGAFSYSLYLTHCAVLKCILDLAQQLHLSPDATLELRAIVGIPVAIGLAFAFHLLFERPFLAKKNQSASAKRSLAQQGSLSVGSS
jgi:peptidoglycan/LPS O-acetylase OafA/YrhL